MGESSCLRGCMDLASLPINVQRRISLLLAEKTDARAPPAPEPLPTAAKVLAAGAAAVAS